MIENSLRIFKSLAIKRYTESNPPRKLIGALGKPDYIAPADDKWRHVDSQSDDEGPELKKKMVLVPLVYLAAAGASSTGAAGGTSAGNDEEDTESGDNPPEPGYEVYYDERGVKRIRRIRQEDDPEYVPSDTEAERLKKKETVVKRKKKARKYIGTSSAQQSVPPQEPTQEAEMDPNLGFTAAEASNMVPSPPRSSEPAPIVSSTPETPTVTPQEPTPSIASTICATTSQPAAERRQTIFSRMQPDEKVDFLFSQLQTAASRLPILSTENASLKAADEVRER
ncbi:hypothetical protein HanRHA438_Chr05g0235121 [Helianthus annuus]|nr:hypothetical protein HanRHA438_Chr05g0235121 [Helianthus annuus]